MSAGGFPNGGDVAPSLRDGVEYAAVIIFGLLSRSQKMEAAAAAGALAVHTTLASHTAGRILDP